MDGDASPASQRFEEVIERYLFALAEGNPPGREELLALHPELAPELDEFLANYRSFRLLGAGAGSPASLGLATGDRLGDYQILEELGRGGMGVVFKARQVSLDRLVALKFILAGPLASSEEVQRFRFEAEAAARLDHPNIIAIHETGEHDGLHFFSMRYVEGGPLSRHLEQFRGQPVRIARLVETISRAVERAHQLGVLHRDLKPANVLIDGAGEPYVADFGLSKGLMGGSGLTGAGAVLGTPSYLAPEQTEAGGERDTAATDVYGLGAILYQLLTGKPPFEGRSGLEVIERLRTREPVRPRAVDPRTPPDLESICLQCLEKEPRRRYPGAGELAQDLRRFIEGRPVQARRLGAPRRAWRACRRNPVVSSLSAGIIAALLILMAGLGWVQQQMEESLWRSHLDHARAERRSGRPGQRLDSLRFLKRAAAIRADPRLRDEAIACLARVDLDPVLRAQLFPGGVLGDPWTGTRDRHPAALDRELRRCARGDEHGGVEVIAVGSGERLGLLPPGETPARRLSFSPDGRLLAVRHQDRRLRVWDLENAVAPRMEVPSVAALEPWDFRSDGLEIAIGLEDGRVVTHDLATGVRRAELRPDEARAAVLHVRYRPDQAALAVCRQGEAPLLVLSAATGEVLKRFPPQGDVSQMAWHPSGRHLAVATSAAIQLLSMGAEPGISLRGPVDGVDYLAFHPGGDLLATSGIDALRVSSIRSGQEILRIEKQSILGFSMDGGSLGSISSLGELAVWRLEGTAEWRAVARIPAGQGLVRGLAIDPDSRFAAVSTGRAVWIFDLGPAREAARLPAGDTMAAIFTPSGEALLTWGERGLFRWAVTREEGPDGRERRRFGPPSRLEVGPPGARPGSASLSADGRTLAVVVDAPSGRICVLDCRSAERRAELAAGGQVEAVAVSPDGLKVAAAGPGTGIVHWDLREEQGSFRRRSGKTDTWVGFSPEGRRLIVGSAAEFSLLDLQSGSAGHRIAKELLGPSVAAVCPAAGLLAFRHSRSSVKLVDVGSGRELAAIETPETSIEVLCFDPTGRWIALGGRSPCLHLLDLARARERLLREGIDCELGTFAASRDAASLPEISLEVDPGDLAW